MDRVKIYNTFAIVCSIWFLVSGTLWTYAIALIAAYPVGLLGLLFWYLAWRIESSKANKVALALLIIGFVLSLASLIFVK